MIDKITKRRLAWFACLCVAAFGLWLVLLRHYIGLATLIEHEVWLRDAINAWPVRALAISFVVYVVMAMIPGLAGKSVIFGWLLGFLQGLFVVNFGLTIAGFAPIAIRWAVHRNLGTSRRGYE